VNLDKLIADIKREVGALGKPEPHVCAPLCYCGSVPTPRSEMEQLRMKVAMLERTVERAREAVALESPENVGRSYGKV
jgi:hypothetical protein